MMSDAKLSGGQVDHVDLIQAAVTGPPFVFLDEPAGKLYTTDKIEVLSTLQYNGEPTGTTEIMTLHNNVHQKLTHR